MIYTVGYAGWTVAELLGAVRELGAVLCDIRYSPRSQRPGFSSGELRQALGADYTHVRALGNRNYRGGPVTLADYERGKAAIAGLLAQGRAPILMCGCADLTICHRLGVAERLAKDLGEVVEHLRRPERSAQGNLFG
jgi:uncharacterized protein (DUF488 family)